MATARDGFNVTKKRRMLGSKKLFVKLQETPQEHTAVIFWDSDKMKDTKRLDESYKKGKYYWAIHDVRAIIILLVAGHPHCEARTYLCPHPRALAHSPPLPPPRHCSTSPRAAAAAPAHERCRDKEGGQGRWRNGGRARDARVRIGGDRNAVGGRD